MSEVQTTYIKKRQITDGPLTVDEVIRWSKITKKKKSCFLKLTIYHKAFDSLNWNFLDSVIAQIGFSVQWRNWIKGCLSSTNSSVLVNGSPTREFKIQKGLHQGYPLSPFLFIFAVAAPHIVIQDAIGKKIFHDIKVGKDGVLVSNLHFANDALIIGEWSLENV